MKRLLLGSFVMLLLTVPSTGFASHARGEPSYEIEVVAQDFEPEGTVIAEDGDEIDVESDLDVQDDESIIIGFRYLPVQGQGLRVRWGKFDFRGRKTLGRTVDYGGETFSNGSTVKTGMDVRFIDLDGHYDLIQSSERDLLNFSVGGRMIQYDGRLVSNGTSAREKVTTVSPVFGVDFRTYLFPTVNVSGQVNGMDVTVDENDFKLVDAELGLAGNPYRDFWLQGGYRVYSVDANHQNDIVDLDFDGFFLNGKFHL